MKNIFNVKRILLILFLSIFTWMILPQIIGQFLVNVNSINTLFKYKILDIEIFEIKRNLFSTGYTSVQLIFSNIMFVVISVIYGGVFYLNDLNFQKK